MSFITHFIHFASDVFDLLYEGPILFVDDESINNGLEG